MKKLIGFLILILFSFSLSSCYLLAFGGTSGGCNAKTKKELNSMAVAHSRKVEQKL